MLIGYARVSTREQDPAYQRAQLEQAGCERIYIETASGAQRDRPQLAEALQYAREGDVLVLPRLDRLARSLRQLLDTVEDLDARGVGLRSLAESIDTTSAGGRLVFQVFGALAEFERELIRERTTAGLDYARSQGRIGGRPRVMDDKTIEQARTLLAHSSLPVTEIARRVGVSRAALYRAFPGGRSAVAVLGAGSSPPVA